MSARPGEIDAAIHIGDGAKETIRADQDGFFPDPADGSEGVARTQIA